MSESPCYCRRDIVSQVITAPPGPVISQCPVIVWPPGETVVRFAPDTAPSLLISATNDRSSKRRTRSESLTVLPVTGYQLPSNCNTACDLVVRPSDQTV